MFISKKKKKEKKATVNCLGEQYEPSRVSLHCSESIVLKGLGVRRDRALDESVALVLLRDHLGRVDVPGRERETPLPMWLHGVLVLSAT